MKIDVRTIVTHPSGTKLKSTPDEVDDKGVVTKEGEPMTVADVLIHTALQPSAPNKTYTPRQQVMRYTLALDAWKAKENNDDSTMHISPRMTKEIADDLCRIYTPVVGGQLLLMLGYSIDDEEDEPEEESRPEQVRTALARARK